MRSLGIASLCVLTSGVALADANPAFLRKLADPDGYRVERDLQALESICGQNDLQFVNDYDGTLGQTLEFVRHHKFSVGALASGSAPNSSKYCSGSLVGPDLFLTASHCVDSSTVGDYVAMNYERMAGSTDLHQQEAFEITEIVEDGRSLDYAVLRVDGMPGLKYGWNTVRTRDAISGEVITIIQHPGGQPKQIDAGHVLSASGNYMRYGDLDTNPGSSGSSIFDAEGHVIGVHTNGGCYSNGGSNSGVRLYSARNAAVISRLAGMAAPLADGAVGPLMATTESGATYYLNANHDLDLILGNAPATDWTVLVLEDGSYRFVTTIHGIEAYLAADPASGRVWLETQPQAVGLAVAFDAVVDQAGDLRLMVVGASDGGRFLAVENGGAVLTERAAARWSLEGR